MSMLNYYSVIVFNYLFSALLLNENFWAVLFPLKNCLWMWTAANERIIRINSFSNDKKRCIIFKWDEKHDRVQLIKLNHKLPEVNINIQKTLKAGKFFEGDCRGLGRCREDIGGKQSAAYTRRTGGESSPRRANLRKLRSSSTGNGSKTPGHHGMRPEERRGAADIEFEGLRRQAAAALLLLILHKMKIIGFL